MNRQPTLARGVYAITACELLDFAQVLGRTSAILKAGVSVLQYRDKRCSAQERLVRAQVLLDLCRSTGTPFVVNDDPALAAAVGADGVHLGADDPPLAAARQRLGPAAIIGVSCYDDVERAIRSARSGADYVTLGAFFPTKTKVPRTFATLDMLRAAKRQITRPVVAIGGITPENSEALIASGADMLAVVSSIYGAEEPARQIARFQMMFGHANGAPI